VVSEYELESGNGFSCGYCWRNFGLDVGPMGILLLVRSWHRFWVEMKENKEKMRVAESEEIREN